MSSSRDYGRQKKATKRKKRQGSNARPPNITHRYEIFFLFHHFPSFYSPIALTLLELMAVDDGKREEEKNFFRFSVLEAKTTTKAARTSRRTQQEQELGKEERNIVMRDVWVFRLERCLIHLRNEQRREKSNVCELPLPTIATMKLQQRLSRPGYY